jgi:hypothetical protein
MEHRIINNFNYYLRLFFTSIHIVNGAFDNSLDIL